MSNPSSASVIITESLEFEPELNYLAWKVSVETFASSKATIISSSGLLTDILTDAEWDALSLNRATSPSGTLTIAARRCIIRSLWA